MSTAAEKTIQMVLDAFSRLFETEPDEKRRSDDGLYRGGSAVLLPGLCSASQKNAWLKPAATLTRRAPEAGAPPKCGQRRCWRGAVSIISGTSTTHPSRREGGKEKGGSQARARVPAAVLPDLGPAATTADKAITMGRSCLCFRSLDGTTPSDLQYNACRTTNVGATPPASACERNGRVNLWQGRVL